MSYSRLTCCMPFVVAMLVCGRAGAVTIFGTESNTGINRLMKFESSNPVGTIVTIGNTGVADGFLSGLDFDAGGALYACSQLATGGPGSFYSINPNTGLATLIGSLNLTAANQVMTDLTYNPVTNQFLGVAFDGTNNFLYAVDKSSGAATLVGQINSPSSIFLGICTDSSGKIYLEDFGGQM